MMAGKSNYSYLQMAKDTLVVACCHYQYKNGAFAKSVTKTTSTTDDLNIIINSPLLAANEKKAFEEARKAVISVQSMGVRDQEFDLLRIKEIGEPIIALQQVIEADMKLRGQYKPPTMVQVEGENGSVGETIVIDDDGPRHYKGGQPGVVPGAPQAFNEAQQKAQKTFVKDPDASGNVPPISVP